MNSVALVLFIAGAANAWFLPLLDTYSGIMTNVEETSKDVMGNTVGVLEDMMASVGEISNDLNPIDFVDTATNMMGSTLAAFEDMSTNFGTFANMTTDYMQAVPNIDPLKLIISLLGRFFGFLPVETMYEIMKSQTNATQWMNLMSNVNIMDEMMQTFNEWMDMMSNISNVNMNSAQDDVCWSSVSTCNQLQIDPYVSFQLFTDTQGNNRTIDRKNATQCPNSNYTVKIIIPDYEILNPNYNWANNINVEYQRNGTYNIIAVNWTKPASQDYMQSAANTKCVGIIVAQFIQYLSTKCNISCNNIHIIGYGLGGHVAGFAGKAIKPVCTVERITGLDPSGRYFQYCNSSQKLSKSDARLVDIIHSDSDGIGTRNVTGTADFYLNGGDAQPGCIAPYCDHRCSIPFYTASIKNITIYGYYCETYPQFTMQMCKNAQTEIAGAGYTGTGPSGSYQVTDGPQNAIN